MGGGGTQAADGADGEARAVAQHARTRKVVFVVPVAVSALVRIRNRQARRGASVRIHPPPHPVLGFLCARKEGGGHARGKSREKVGK